MATFEDELLADAEDDRLTVEFIQNYLPQEVKERFSEDDLYYLIDLIGEYYTEFLDKMEKKGGKGHDDDEIDIDIDEVAAYLAKQAKKEKMGDFDPEDLRWVVEGELEYGEQHPDDDTTR